MKINCISCGHNVNLDDMYEDYAGQIKCFACAAILEIKLEAGKPKSIKLARPKVRHAGVKEGVPAGGEGLSYA